MMKQEGMFLCPLFSGSSGNATAVGLGEGRLLVDAGKPCKALTQALLQAGIQPETIQGLLITHEHIDHVRGAGVFSRRYDVPIYANQGTWEAMIPLIGAIAPHNIRVFDTGRVAAELMHFFLLMTGNKYAAEPFIGHFLWEYACHFPDRERTFEQTTRRVPFYMGTTLLRIARNPWLDWNYRLRLIHEAKQCLRRWYL